MDLDMWLPKGQITAISIHFCKYSLWPKNIFWCFFCIQIKKFRSPMDCRPSWEWLSALLLCVSTLHAQSHYPLQHMRCRRYRTGTAVWELGISRSTSVPEGMLSSLITIQICSQWSDTNCYGLEKLSSILQNCWDSFRSGAIGSEEENI